MNNPEPLLSARDLRKAYSLGKRSVEVLRGVSLEVARGDFIALRGASGAGKSTLLHLMGGLDEADAGQVTIDGRDLLKLSQAERARFRNERVGFIFQAYHLFPEFDALENVSIPGRIARRGAKEVRERARALLDRVGLGHREDHRPAELSGGERQRVAIARALINDPQLVLADEPTGNLDSHAGEEILNLLRALRDERQTTLIIATHDAAVAAHAGRVIQLLDGQIQTPPIVT
jgi:lipoprotein-releasing system ATP-binding protein